MSKRIDVKVTTSCGNSWVAGINATFEEAKAYYMGRRFETLVPDKKAWDGVREVLQGPVISVEFLGYPHGDQS
jgi:hypothetical protein